MKKNTSAHNIKIRDKQETIFGEVVISVISCWRFASFLTQRFTEQSQSYTELHRVTQSYTELHRVTQSYTELHRVVTELHRVFFSQCHLLLALRFFFYTEIHRVVIELHRVFFSQWLSVLFLFGAYLYFLLHRVKSINN